MYVGSSSKDSNDTMVVLFTVAEHNLVACKGHKLMSMTSDMNKVKIVYMSHI